MACVHMFAAGRRAGLARVSMSAFLPPPPPRPPPRPTNCAAAPPARPPHTRTRARSRPHRQVLQRVHTLEALHARHDSLAVLAHLLLPPAAGRAMEREPWSAHTHTYTRATVTAHMMKDTYMPTTQVLWLMHTCVAGRHAAERGQLGCVWHVWGCAGRRRGGRSQGAQGTSPWASGRVLVGWPGEAGAGAARHTRPVCSRLLADSLPLHHPSPLPHAAPASPRPPPPSYAKNATCNQHATCNQPADRMTVRPCPSDGFAACCVLRSATTATHLSVCCRSLTRLTWGAG